MRDHLDSTDRIPALDGLRGLAILLVLLAHFTPEAEGRSLVGRLFFGFANLGWVGVDLFFVLSGFLITGILYDAKGSEHYFRNFYARRVLRIFPLYYGCLFAIFVLVPWINSTPSAEMQRLIDAQGWLWAHCANILLALRGAWDLHTTNLSLHHFWSLAVEEHFYLVWPLLVALFARRTLLAIALALSVCAVALRLWLYFRTGNEVAVYVLTPCRMDQLLAGAAVALVARGPNEMSALSRAAPVTLVASTAAAIVLHALDRFAPAAETIGYSLWAILFASLLVIVVARPAGSVTRRFFETPVMCFFGKYSYAMYVLHALFIMPLVERVSLRARLAEWTGSTALAVVLTLALCVAVTVLMSMLSWHLFEKHFLKLKRFFEYERHSASDAIAAPVGLTGDPAGLNRDQPVPPAPQSLAVPTPAR